MPPTLGENLTTYCKKLTEAARILRVTSYLSGTQPEPFDLLRDVKILRIIHSTVPAGVHRQLTKLNSASECFKTLKILFGVYNYSYNDGTTRTVRRRATSGCAHTQTIHWHLSEVWRAQPQGTRMQVSLGLVTSRRSQRHLQDSETPATSRNGRVSGQEG